MPARWPLNRFDDGRGQWLVAFRRSNLDVVAYLLDADLGEPQLRGRLRAHRLRLSDRTRGSLHVLLSSDKAHVTNAAGTEEAKVRYPNSLPLGHARARLLAAARYRARCSRTRDVSSERDGAVDEPDRRTGAVDDQRDYDVLGLKLDATYSGERWLHRFGVEARSLDARYDYSASVRLRARLPVSGQRRAGRHATTSRRDRRASTTPPT